MLRITLPTASHAGLFILEGRLTGLWAKELLRVARGTNRESGNIFDLRDVFYVDSAGEEALRSLGGRGARFIIDSAYGKDLCSRLHLHRATASNLENKDGKGSGGSHALGQGESVHAGRLDQLIAADVNQHPQRYSE